MTSRQQESSALLVRALQGDKADKHNRSRLGRSDGPGHRAGARCFSGGSGQACRLCPPPSRGGEALGTVHRVPRTAPHAPAPPQSAAHGTRRWPQTRPVACPPTVQTSEAAGVTTEGHGSAWHSLRRLLGSRTGGLQPEPCEPGLCHSQAALSFWAPRTSCRRCSVGSPFDVNLT